MSCGQNHGAEIRTGSKYSAFGIQFTCAGVVVDKARGEVSISGKFVPDLDEAYHMANGERVRVGTVFERPDLQGYLVVVWAKSDATGKPRYLMAYHSRTGLLERVNFDHDLHVVRY